MSFFFSLPLVVTLQTTAYNQGQLPISVKLRRESIGIAQVGHQILIATKHSLHVRASQITIETQSRRIAGEKEENKSRN